MSEQTTFFRHHNKAVRRAILVPTLLGLSQLADAAAVTRPEQLIDVTRGFLEHSVKDYLQRSQIEGRHQVEVNRLDPRLRLAQCDAPLSTTLESPAQPIGRATVRVSCEGSSPWSIFVPAQVYLYRQVIVASRPLKRDSILGNADVAIAERDVGLLSHGYLTELDQVLGNKLTRGIQPHQVITPNQITQAEVVRKGDQVVISAKNTVIKVRMPGEALDAGALGAQIRVKNVRSGRTIKARVVGPGQVEVDM